MHSGQLVWHEKLGLGKIISADYMSGWSRQERKVIKVAFLGFWPLVEVGESDLILFNPSEEFNQVLKKLVRSELFEGRQIRFEV